MSNTSLAPTHHSPNTPPSDRRRRPAPETQAARQPTLMPARRASWQAPAVTVPTRTALRAPNPQPAGSARAVAAARTINVGGASHRAINLFAVQPGDIGIEYKEQGKSWKQAAISFGERLVNMGGASHHGSPHVIHAFVVVQSLPYLNQLVVVDAAGGSVDDPTLNRANTGDMGVSLIRMDFANRACPYVDFDAHHLFYRFRDPRMGRIIAQIARNWANGNVDNFNMWHAVSAPLHPKGLNMSAQERVLHVARHALDGRPIPALDGRGFYSVMCSEFVAYVGAAAALWLNTPPGNRPSHRALGALFNGPGGHVFECDPRGMVPSALQARLCRDPKVKVIGYLPSPNG